MKKITTYHILVGLLALLVFIFLANYLIIISIAKSNIEAWVATLLFSLSVSVIFIIIYLLFKLFEHVLKLNRLSHKIAQGQIEANAAIKTEKLFIPLLDSLLSIIENIKNTTNFAVALKEEKLDAIFKTANPNDGLANALLAVQDKLKKITVDDQERKLYAKGRYEIGEHLRQAQRSGNLQELYDTFLKTVINYLVANQGAIFLINEEESSEPFIELASVYAYSKKRYLEKKMSLKEGLIGQCILEKSIIYLEEIPNNYIHITSGLGSALPKALLIVPIKTNEKVLGAVEIASFHSFSQNELNLAEILAERLGGTITAIQSNLQTKKLLDTSNRINRKLIQKEEQMRTNAEELSQTKEVLSKKLIELEQETNLSSHILEAINKTNASVEFDFQGNILQVNDMYLRVMGYKKEELVGANEKMLLPADEIDSEKYQILWDSIRSGSYITGEYRRMSKSGREIWLNGTYNPIFDIRGKLSKVIQFSQFTTEEKEKDLDYASKITALNQSLSVLELDLQGNIKTANQMIAQITGHKRSQLIGKNLSKFTHPMPEFAQKWENLKEGIAQSMTLALIAQDESLLFFFANFSPIKNLGGKIYKVQLIMVDTTEQKEMEIELLNRQEKMSEIVRDLEEARTKLQDREKELEKLLAQERAKNVILSTQDAEDEALFAEKLSHILSYVSEQKGGNNLTSLLEKAAMPALAINTNGNIILSNQEMQAFLHFSSSEVNILNIKNLLNAEGTKNQETMIDKILKGDVVQQSVVIKGKQDSYLPARLISMPIFSGNADILIFLLAYQPAKEVSL